MTTRLAETDLERLRYALGTHEVAADRSLFGPGSVTWRVNREAVLLLGGGRALLMQVAHPLVAAGVAGHSDYQRDPLGRLQRTLELTLTITFADAARAIRAVRTIERVHARVHGTLGAEISPFARGTVYDANAPDLLFWVHATLVETALLVYQRYVGSLSVRDRAQYYEESKITARLMGIPNHLIPARYADFKLYMTGMLQGPLLRVGSAARAIAASILRPPLPRITRPAFWLTGAMTIALLPPVLRQRYGLAGRRAPNIVAQSLAWITPPMLPWLPNALRLMPHARQARA